MYFRDTCATGKYLYRQSGGLFARFLFGLLLVAGLSLISSNNTAYATATQSTLTLTVPIHVLNVSLTPGHFEESDSASIGVRTDNFTGYSLSIASATSTSLINTNNDEITSIDSALSEANFISGNYGGKFGYKPSQYVTTSNNINTVVSNTNYLPIPSTTGDTIDVTSVANTTDNTYSLSFGVKASSDQPAGNYTYHYIISAVGNESVYTVTYDANAGSDTVSNMPSPNPQPLRVAAGTAAASSYDNLSSNVPTRVGYTFAGWCSEQATLDSTTGNQVCGGTTYAAGDPFGVDQTAEGTTLYAIWNINVYRITFDTLVSGETPTYVDKKYNEELGTLPHPTRSGFELEGWYPNTNWVSSEKISSSTTVTADTTYYAHWVESPFATVWSHEGACEFHGATGGNITGSECTEYHDVRFIDTGIALYNDDNYLLDYEIHFTIDHYSPSEQVNHDSGDDSQQTFVNDKLSSTVGNNSPGIVVRRNGTKISVKSTNSDSDNETKEVQASGVDEVSIYRIDNVIYYSINNGPLVYVHDTTGFDQQFELTTWFGGYPANECTGGEGSVACTVKRVPEATFSNMYIKLGNYPDSDLHTITFLGNGGTPTSTNYLIADGGRLGSLPSVTRTNWVFDGWYTDPTDGTEVQETDTPHSDDTYYAHWLKSVAIAQIASTNITIPLNDTGAISVTDSAEVEPYTFTSNNTSVVAVDPTTGALTPVAVGTTTITMTGTKSGDTRIIDISVTGDACTVSFNAEGGYGVASVFVEQGAVLTEIPYTKRNGYVLEGWYTGANGTGTKLTTSTQIMASTEYHANWIQGDFVCKIASTLHVEQCNQTGTNGCRGGNSHFAAGQDITYGSIVTSSTLTPGSAYDCDVNFDGTYDSVTERFYYFGIENGNAKMVHYANIKDENLSYSSAASELPDAIEMPGSTVPAWTNPNLVTFDDGTTYINKAARFMTYPEALALWDGTASGIGPDGTSLYLLEQSAFANENSTGKFDGIWIEQQTNNSNRIQTRSRSLDHKNLGGTTLNSPRATIEIPEYYLERYFVPSVTYTITFNPHNGESSSSVTINAESAIGSANIPADPTNSDPDQVFMGWFTEASGGTAIDGSTIPSADGETYHAQWKKIVCKLETSAANLHTATRHSDGVLVTYGYIADNTTPEAGDAYNCDVDYDDTYSAANERFYYLGQDGNDNAVLVAWNSYYDSDWAPGVSGNNGDTIYHYTDALLELPANTNGAWDNPGLIEQEPGKAARFTTHDEVATACGPNVAVGTQGELAKCDYFMEHSAYDNNGRSALWLMMDGSTYYRIHSGDNNRQVSTSSSTQNSMVRPTIVVPYKLIEKFTSTLLDVTNAVISNNDLTVPVGGQITILVSNSASLEPYTFSSDDTSIATVDSSTGVITGVSAGTTNIIMTGTQSNLTKSLEVDVLAAPVPTYRVTFNSNGGSSVEPRDVEQNTALGSLPTAPTKTNNRFFGWYTDDGTFYTEVYPTTVVDGDVTYYARWVEDTASLPIVFAETNACIFSGSAISGDYCTENEVDGTSIDKTRAYIDTAVALYDTADTYDLDYEIGFTLVSYNYGNTNQMTIVAAKWEDGTAKWPGLAVRRMDRLTTLEFTHSMGTKKATDSNTETETVHQVKVARQNGKIKFSVNGGSWVELQDLDGKTPQYFNDTVWFGSSSVAGREFVGTLTDMYVKLEAASASSYEIIFDTNGGSTSEGSRSVTAGDPLGAFPTVTPPNSYETLSGWLNESNVLITDGTTYYPNKNETLIAQWAYNSSDTPVVFDVSNDATRGYQAIINNWVQSPINITTFNKNTTTINNSTWGNLSELSEAQFWTGLKDNFETNHCMVPTSYGDAATTTPNPTAWTNGTIDCSKPDEYDTQIGEPLNVYLYNNQTLGAQVTYANASDGVIRNLIPGNTYKWVKDGDSTVYGYVTVTSNGSDHGTRWIDAGVIRNVRDLGGLPADTNNDGTVDAYVDYGRLFRGEKLWTAPSTNLTNLGITKEYDVGNPSEYSGNTQLSSYQNDQVIHYNFDYNSGDENNANSNYMRAWTAVTHIMQDIADSNNPQNIYFHCRVGADRTGTVAYILEGLLGVPDEYRYEEYELTHLSGLFDRTRYYKQKSSSNNLKFVFMMDYLQTTADILTWYYHNPNADSNLVAAFRSAMTTPIQQQQQSSAPEGNNTNSLSNNFLQLNNTKNLIANNTEEKEATTTTNDTVIGNENEDDGSKDGYSDPLGASMSAEAISASNTATVIGATVAVATAVAAGSAAYSRIKKEN